LLEHNPHVKKNWKIDTFVLDDHAITSLEDNICTKISISVHVFSSSQ
jgi:hypothetical protein